MFKKKKILECCTHYFMVCRDLHVLFLACSQAHASMQQCCLSLTLTSMIVASYQFYYELYIYIYIG